MTSIEKEELPSLAVIDAIDKWVHKQTRFHLVDTDGYREMLTDVAAAIEQQRSREIAETKMTLLTSLKAEADRPFGNVKQMIYTGLDTALQHQPKQQPPLDMKKGNNHV